MACLSFCTSQFMLMCVSRSINVCHCLCLFMADETVGWEGGGGEVEGCVCVCVCLERRERGWGG